MPSLSEAAPTADATVVRRGDCSRRVTVTCAAAAGLARAVDDYLATSRVMVFDIGQTEALCSVPLRDDQVVEGPEYFTLKLSAPSSGTSLGQQRQLTVVLEDDDDAGEIQLADRTANTSENSGQVTLTLVRTGPSLNAAATVRWAAANGTATLNADYALLPGETNVVSFAPGQTTATLTVAIRPDAVPEGVEQFRVQLVSATGGATIGSERTAAVFVAESEVLPAYAFEADVVRASELEALARVRISRNDPTYSASVSVRLLNGTAALTTDYSGPSTVTVSFAAGEASATLDIPIVDDALLEGQEYFVLQLTPPTVSAMPSAARAIVIIRDNDVPAVPVQGT